MRIIALFDMDAFFASVEQAKNPNLVGKPIAVGSSDRRAVVATCSYEARKYGVKSAMPSYQAKKLCKDLIFVKPDFKSYKEYSERVGAIFKKYTDIIEFASIDEAYLDFTGVCSTIEEAEKTIMAVKNEIREKLSITATAGLSVNKFVAKIASEIMKPNGLTVVKEEDVIGFIENLPIEKIRGVGGSTLEIMKSNSIHSGLDLKNKSMDELKTLFGEKRANWFYKVVRGEDDRIVEVEKNRRKSISQSQTFLKDIKKDFIAWNEISSLINDVSRQMKYLNLKGRTVTIKIKYNDFTIQTRSKTIDFFTNDEVVIKKVINDIFNNSEKLVRPVRLFGVVVSNFEIEEEEPLW